MGVYGGIDLHSSSMVVVLIDEGDRVVLERKVPNRMDAVLDALSGHGRDVEGLVVESTFNWYWLVDGLMEAGYRVHLANPSAMQRYSGQKHADDRSDARWLANMLRLGILPEGYIYPREWRGVRDLLRKRGQLVRQAAGQVVSIQSLVERATGVKVRGDAVKRLTEAELSALLPEGEWARAAVANLRVYRCLAGEVKELERLVLGRAKPRPEFEGLLGVMGVGKILGLTILLETGDVTRFSGPGRFASYCRCVPSEHTSNGRRKGRGNTKNGNVHLGWAFVEAAHFAVRFYPEARRYYERKRSRTNGAVATKAVAHKLARATYHVMRDGAAFEPGRAFA